MVRLARIYTVEEHGISRRMLDKDALKVTERLGAAGYQAYIVGGAVRDLLIGKTPKDYDIATDAYPAKVRKIFRNSRVIGRRFRLVHVFFKNEKILEVATFRSLEGKDGENVYGSMDEDARRRDFTLNALYYSPREEQIIDYHEGVRDIQNRKLRSVIPVRSSFKEDPVRMLRGVKYGVMTGARIPFSLAFAIRKNAPLLRKCSVSRMSEELFKILRSGFSESIIRQADRLKLFEQMLPSFHNALHRRDTLDFPKRFYRDLQKLDKYILKSGEEKSRGKMLYYIFRSFAEAEGFLKEGSQTDFSTLTGNMKKALLPMIAPNREMLEAARLIFKQNGWKVPRQRIFYATRAGKRWHRSSRENRIKKE